MRRPDGDGYGLWNGKEGEGSGRLVVLVIGPSSRDVGCMLEMFRCVILRSIEILEPGRGTASMVSVAAYVCIAGSLFGMYGERKMMEPEFKSSTYMCLSYMIYQAC